MARHPQAQAREHDSKADNQCGDDDARQARLHREPDRTQPSHVITSQRETRDAADESEQNRGRTPDKTIGIHGK